MTNEWTYRRLRKNFKTAISDMKTKPGLLKSVVLNRSNQVLYKEEEVIPIQTILEDKKAKIRLVDKQVSDVAYDLACIHSEVAVMNFMGRVDINILTENPFIMAKEMVEKLQNNAVICIEI